MIATASSSTPVAAYSTQLKMSARVAICETSGYTRSLDEKSDIDFS
jgi:hypothetical protein